MNFIGVIANKEETTMISNHFHIVLQSTIIITIECHQIPQ